MCIAMRVYTNTITLAIILTDICPRYTCSSYVNITIAVLNERSSVTDYPSSNNRTIGVIERAMNKSREILQHVANVEFIIKNLDYPICTNSHWGAMIAELYYRQNINAIIGPGCTTAVQLAARMASSWRLPIMTYGGTGESMADKTEFTTLSRLSYTMNQFAQFYIEVFKAFNWVDIANIADSIIPPYHVIRTSLQSSFEKQGFRPKSLTFDSGEADLDAELLRVLMEAKQVSRVFVVCAHGDIYRRMTLLARQLGLERGEYVFIFFSVLKGDVIEGDFSWRRGDNLDQEALQAYESVLAIGPLRPYTEEFLAFEKEAMQRATEVYGYVWGNNSELNVFNIAYYDCFVLYAYALNETLAAGEDHSDGTNIQRRMWNRTFPGIGGMFYMNPNGDRDADFALKDLDPVTGKWRVVAQYLGYTQAFNVFYNLIHWPNGGTPPVNMPRCGFSGELCVTYALPTYAIVAIAFSIVIIIVLVAGGVTYRRIKAEADLHSQWWKIKLDDIIIQATTASVESSISALQEGISKSQSNITFKIIGVYKGTQVYIQKPKIKSLSVDRKLLLELKQMRDVTSPNLTRLIGICPEPNCICIISEYCSRGSLQDILQNESIQLDWDFRISLITDIVQGMYYIHTSPIEVHGRLTSSRCVIDSRFVLKITGYGLKSLTNLSDAEKGKNKTYRCMSPELLWMAPESLRGYPPRQYTQSGDVYSFAIILYEMCTRKEPYVTEDWYETVEDTVKRIRGQNQRPLRPDFGDKNSELRRLTEACWDEDPDARPSFAAIKKNLQTLRRGSKRGRNILDTLLQRMEHYANNLEGLVEERTRAFLEEKKKSEELLYQVLPRSVANQLRSGQPVIPEAYDSVTIYFSDIVGFTAMSSDSTPFQVVDLLNDVYTCFDEIIDEFDVYKVETIGDAYMVVSGLPVRNGNEHARHIARMSLRILAQVNQFTIRHLPEIPLRVRIGIHSGGVCAGVVGRKMPRYCLFGDTVNTASRMESNGEAMKIHISSSTKDLLDYFVGSFVTEERGFINIKIISLMSKFRSFDSHLHAIRSAMEATSYM